MLIVRGTKKLRDRVKAPLARESEKSTTVLGDWFATALFVRPQHLALLVNARTLLPVIMPLAPATTLLDRIPDAIASVLRQHGIHESVIASELDAMGDRRLASTNDRSVIGVMNGFSLFIERRHDLFSDLDELSMRLSQPVVGPLMGRAGSPDRELAAVLDSDRSNVIPFRRPTSPSPAAPATPRSGRGDVLQLKVTLLHTKPPIWRRILVDGSATLDHLHEVIQAAFGWWNCHLHEFDVGGIRYAIPDPDWDDIGPPPRDERRTRLDMIAAPGSTFQYDYDFGDGWEHQITVEKVVPANSVPTTPACIDGRRAGPPEDCGGPWGHQELLAVLADPKHPEYAARVEWFEGMGRGRFDPDTFDPAEFEDNLANVRLATFED